MGYELPRSGRLIDRIKINRVEHRQLNGRAYWVKRRLGWSRLLIPCANTFFALAGNPVRVLADLEEWQQRELASFHTLHGAEGYTAFYDPEQHAVWAMEMPGISVEEPARKGLLNRPTLTAIATELKRAHRLPSPAQGGLWSHGDPHMGNFLLDESTGRVRLIDFEVLHAAHLSETERQADDLLVVLQCMMEYGDLAAWLQWCHDFLDGYQQVHPDEATSRTILCLRSRLKIPHTLIERLWWAVRTAYLPEAERNRRIVALKESLGSYPLVTAI